jgi:putative salt-induced outer membrane protein YdiY
MKRGRFLICLLAIAVGVGAASDARAASKEKSGWNRHVRVGLNVTEGNKDSTQTRVDVGAKGAGEGWAGELNLQGEVGEVDSEKNRERISADASVRSDLSPKAYLSGRLEFLYDGIANLDYRVIASPSVGYYVLRGQPQWLRVEIGPAAVVEKKDGEREVYPALRAAQYYEGRLTAVSRLLQGVEYLPELRVNDGKYLLKAFLELRAELDAQFTLHVRLESAYDSQPAEDKEEQDTTFSTSISYTF